MPLEYVRGDLLKSDCEVIAHQANCFSVFGAGVAGQIAEQFPEAVAADRQWGIPPEGRLGWYLGGPSDGMRIAHLYGQYHPGANTEYLAAGLAFKRLLDTVPFDMKVGLPYLMGCGIGGGDWAVMSAIIEQVAARRRVYAYVLPGVACPTLEACDAR